MSLAGDGSLPENVFRFTPTDRDACLFARAVAAGSAPLRGNCWRWIGLVGSGWIMIATMGLACGVGEPPPASAPLPQAPEGVRILAVAAFEPKEQEPVRIAAHPVTGRLYVLGGGGD